MDEQQINTPLPADQPVMPILASINMMPPTPPPPRQFDKAKLILPGAIILAGLLISGSVMYSTMRGLPGSGTATIGTDNRPIDVSVDDDPALGNPNAPVTMIEFSDFECPFCRIFWKDTFSKIKTQYIDTGKVKFVYRDYPLPFHPGAIPAAKAANCAFAQGKFWEFQDAIFSGQDKRDPSGTVDFGINDIKQWVANIGLDQNKFNSCLATANQAEIDHDLQDGTNADVSGTPTFFINGTRIVGAQPFSAFQAVIEQLLNK